MSLSQLATITSSSSSSSSFAAALRPSVFAAVIRRFFGALPVAALAFGAPLFRPAPVAAADVLVGGIVGNTRDWFGCAMMCNELK
jgi:hypothetical protein